MNIRLDELIKAIATSLDFVEIDLLGATTNHGKRIATLCARMGACFGMDRIALSALTTCALFHDNALTEYILSEKEGSQRLHNLRLHCEIGQRNVEALPLGADVHGYILYHHEHADGSGLFGKREGEYPLGAELIAIADMLDVKFHIQTVPADDLPRLRAFIQAQSGERFTHRATDAMLEVLDEAMLRALRDDRIYRTAAEAIPEWSEQVENEAFMRIAEFAAKIIDYKSIFTRKHSAQIAGRAWIMSEYYGFDETMRAQIYLAAALHDLGKLSTPIAILEKPGRLDPEEFSIIKDHVRCTEELLRDIGGFENICRWASNHHEKLDGSGYHRSKNADELDFISRMMACIDIYQAVSEPRPYHEQRSHEATMVILRGMADSGQLDSRIVADMDTVMASYSGIDVPVPI